MKLVYVASPYAGDIEKNTEFAKEACRFVMDEGHAFFAPHLLYPQVLDENNSAERKLGLAIGKEVLGRCDELWVFGEIISPGIQAEIELAQEHEVPVKYINSQEVEERERPFAERHSFCSMQL